LRAQALQADCWIEARGAVASTRSKAPSFEPSICPIDFPAELTVDCGVVTVPNNRAAHGHVDRNGSVDRLPVAVIRAPTPDPEADPIVYVSGGPSFNVLVDSFSAEFFSGLPFAKDRDIILYNQRGVGFAQPRLGCPEFDALRADTFPEGPSPDQYLDAVHACRERLVGEGIDLSAYNAAEEAADLDDIRSALGYEKWNLYVLSAGGSVGLTAMRLFPTGIRSVIRCLTAWPTAPRIHSAPRNCPVPWIRSRKETWPSSSPVTS
jgi:pimeloyl-ACP methyl ester carboxylesterase